MTDQTGPTEAARAEEIAEYLQAVQAATRDLPPAQRQELLDDLATHLAEVAAESSVPLRQRLGPPEQYAAELRAAASGDPESAEVRPSYTQRLRTRWQRLRARLSRLDQRLGPWLGYERITEYARLLVPAWWLLRGYLAAMLVVHLLDHSGQLGLLPRLGGSTLAGLAILAGFIVGSVWLAHRTPRWSRWPRRVVMLGSTLVVLFGVNGFLDLDFQQRYGPPTFYREVVYDNPYQEISDVYVIDEHGQLLTEVTLVDQHGRPIDIGWCDDYSWEEWPEEESRWRGPDGEPMVSYPRCPDQLPWWLSVLPAPSPHPAPSPGAVVPSPSPVEEPAPAPSGDPTPEPTATVTTSPAPNATPLVTPEVTVAPTARAR